MPTTLAAISPHRSEAEFDLEANMETDPTETLDDRYTEEEGELSDQHEDRGSAGLYQVLFEEQTYQETVRGIRPYVG